MSDITGLDDVLRRMTAVGVSVEAASEGALAEIAENIVGDAKEIVPIDLGALKSSGHVLAPERRGNDVTCAMGFGGQSADYAEIVHENLSPSVQWQTPGTGPKYLEKPFLAATATFTARIAAHLRARVGL